MLVLQMSSKTFDLKYNVCSCYKTNIKKFSWPLPQGSKPIDEFIQYIICHSRCVNGKAGFCIIICLSHRFSAPISKPVLDGIMIILKSTSCVYILVCIPLFCKKRNCNCFQITLRIFYTWFWEITIFIACQDLFWCSCPHTISKTILFYALGYPFPFPKVENNIKIFQ